MFSIPDASIRSSTKTPSRCFLHARSKKKHCVGPVHKSNTNTDKKQKKMKYPTLTFHKVDFDGLHLNERTIVIRAHECDDLEQAVKDFWGAQLAKTNNIEKFQRITISFPPLSCQEDIDPAYVHTENVCADLGPPPVCVDLRKVCDMESKINEEHLDFVQRWVDKNLSFVPEFLSDVTLSSGGSPLGARIEFNVSTEVKTQKDGRFDCVIPTDTSIAFNRPMLYVDRPGDEKDSKSVQLTCKATFVSVDCKICAYVTDFGSRLFVDGGIAGLKSHGDAGNPRPSVLNFKPIPEWVRDDTVRFAEFSGYHMQDFGFLEQIPREFLFVKWDGFIHTTMPARAAVAVRADKMDQFGQFVDNVEPSTNLSWRWDRWAEKRSPVSDVDVFETVKRLMDSIHAYFKIQDCNHR